MSNAEEMMERIKAMKAELKVEEPEVVKEEVAKEPEEVVKEEVPSEPNYSDAEKVARSQGWRPKEEYKGNPNDWVDAETFVERGPVFRHVEKLKKTVEAESKENAKLRDMVSALLEDIREAEAKAREKVLKEIENKKAAAEEANDLLTYKALQEQEAEYKKKEVVREPEPVKGPSEEYKAVVARHPWIEHIHDDDLAAEKYFYCDREINKLLKVNPRASEAEQFAVIDRVIAERYTPEKESKPKVSSVSGGAGAKPKETAKVTLSNLTPAQKYIYDRLKDSSYGMSQEDYLKSLNNRTDK